MAVIITDIDMPKSCMDCPLTYLDCGDDAYFGRNEHRCVFDGSCIEGDRSERQYDCPLKSTDEMIEEIEETYINNCDFSYPIAIDIIYKYTKENTVESKN